LKKQNNELCCKLYNGQATDDLNQEKYFKIKGKVK